MQQGPRQQHASFTPAQRKERRKIKENIQGFLKRAPLDRKPVTLRLLAGSYMKLGEYSEAIKYYKMAMDFAEKHKPSWAKSPDFHVRLHEQLGLNSLRSQVAECYCALGQHSESDWLLFCNLTDGSELEALKDPVLVLRAAFFKSLGYPISEELNTALTGFQLQQMSTEHFDAFYLETTWLLYSPIASTIIQTLKDYGLLEKLYNFKAHSSANLVGRFKSHLNLKSFDKSDAYDETLQFSEWLSMLYKENPRFLPSFTQYKQTDESRHKRRVEALDLADDFQKFNIVAK